MRKAFFALLLAGCTAGFSAQAQQDAQIFEGPVVGAKGEAIGKLTIRGGKDATVIRIAVNPGGLTPGWHGTHFHDVGDCSDVGKFQLSKGHVNHGGKAHGLLNAQGPDDGDLPNIFANADGSANAELSSRAVRLSGGATALTDKDGAALVIHASEDDHTSQPIGNAGARVGCVEIK
jgi:Cu-Zn family superoxide dismutase